jgi:hypothetical protein
VWPERFEHSHSEQFYIHESMFNSLFRLLDGSYFPYTLKGKNLQNAVKNAFPELTTKYGSEVSVALAITMTPNNTATPIQINQSGIVLGSQDDVTTSLSILCSNSSVQNEEAALFSMNLEAQGNFSMKNLVFYPKVDAIIIQNTVVKKSHVQLGDRDLNALFTSLLVDESSLFNTKWVKGWSIASIDPALAMLTGLLKNTTLTPYVMDGYFYAGFGM